MNSHFSSRCTTKSIAKKSPTGTLPPAVLLAITPTLRPWTHTSDDNWSYIYQLSLVVATATVSFFFFFILITSTYLYLLPRFLNASGLLHTARAFVCCTCHMQYDGWQDIALTATLLALHCNVVVSLSWFRDHRSRISQIPGIGETSH